MGVQHVEKGVDITTTGQAFVLDIGAADLVDLHVDGTGSADYEVRAGPNTATIYPAAVDTFSGTDANSTGNRVATQAIAVHVTGTALSGTADIYLAARKS